ncbi:MAG: hypothetical protein EXX96DRAFT_554388, partial [Benjaminiella poitrasii]
MVLCDNIENSSWLDDYWDEERNEVIIPETSTSSEDQKNMININKNFLINS